MQLTEHRVSLFSGRTYDSLGRILDLLRKMEFELTELCLVNTNGMAEITVSFRRLGRHSPDELLRGIGQIVGVSLTRADDSGPDEMAEERPWSTCEFARG